MHNKILQPLEITNSYFLTSVLPTTRTIKHLLRKTKHKLANADSISFESEVILIVVAVIMFSVLIIGLIAIRK